MEVLKMVDITKDEFWENKFEEVYKRKKKNTKFKNIIEEHKWIALLIASFAILAISNGFLIYNFLKILSKL